MATELATAYISLVPTTRGIQGLLGRALGGPAASAGAAAGRAAGDSMRSGIAGKVAGISAMVGGAFAIGKTVDFAKNSIIGFNSTLQQSTIAFTTMLGSATKADTFVRQLQAFAAKTPFEFQGLVGNAQSLMGMGIAAQDVLPDLTALGDSVASVGGNAGTLNNTISAFGQTMAKGTLDMGNMNQLLQGGIPNALKILASHYKVTTGEMVKMISTGKVQSKDALPALVKGIEHGTKATAALGGMMDKQSKTFQGAMSNISDSLTQSIAHTFLPLFNAASKRANDLATFLAGPTFQRISHVVTGLVVKGFALLGDVLARVRPVAARVFTQLVAAIPGIIRWVSQLRPVFERTFSVAALVVRTVIGTIKDILPSVIPVATTMRDFLAATFSKILGVVQRTLPVARAVIGNIATAIRNVLPVILPLVSTIRDFLVAAWNKALVVVKALGVVLSAVTGFMRTHATLVRSLVVAVGGAVLAWKAWQLAVTVWSNVTKAAKVVQEAFNAVMKANTVMLVVVAIAALAAGLIYAYKHSATFRRIVQDAFKAVKAVVLGVVNWFKGPFVNFFTKTIPSAFRAMGHFISSAFRTVVGFLRTWGPVALAVLAPFIGIPLLIWQHFRQIKGFLSRVWSDAIGGIKSFISNAVSWIGQLPGKIAAFGGKMVSAGASLIGKLWDGLKSLGSSAMHFVGNIIGDIGQGIKNVLNDVLHLPWVLPQFRVGAFGHYITIGGETLFPALARGGMTTGPTMALVGDNPSGRELVMPMDSPHTVSLLGKAMENAGKGGKTVMGGRLEIAPDSAGRLRAWVRDVVLDEADLAASHARMR